MSCETQNSTKYTETDEKQRFRRSKNQLTRMGMIFFALEIFFGIEMALVIPILLKLNISEKFYSYTYILCSFCAFLFQPAIGYLSDRCTSKFGRRRPFILVLALSSFIGLTLLLNGNLLNKIFGYSLYKPLIGQIIVIIGVNFLDFSIDSCDTALKALMLDVCNMEDKDTALNIHAFLGGIGEALGFLLSAINWIPDTSNIIISDYQVIYGICSLFFVVSLILTMTSVKEEPLKIDIFKKDSENKPSLFLGLLKFYLSILDMPKELARLFLYHLIGWMALFSTEMFFTNFVAHSVFNGEPNANKNTQEFLHFNEGTRMGSVGLITFSLSCSISAFLLENFLLKRVSSKFLYSMTFIVYSACCIAIYFIKNIFIIIPLCSSFGILMSALITLPFQMLSEFHLDENYVNKSRNGIKRGYGIDCALIGSAYFLAQTIVASFMSFLTFNFGYRVIFIVAALLSLLNLFITHIFVIFPKKNASNR